MAGVVVAAVGAAHAVEAAVDVAVGVGGQTRGALSALPNLASCPTECQAYYRPLAAAAAAAAALLPLQLCLARCPAPACLPRQIPACIGKEPGQRSTTLQKLK